MHDNKEAAIIDKILKCNTSKDAGDWYHSLFRSLSADALRELANHPSDTIACQAAWRSSSHRDRIVARDTLYWAIGIIQGRLKMTLPVAWQLGLGRLRAGGQEGIQEYYRQYRKEHPALFVETDGILLRRGLNYKRAGDFVVPDPLTVEVGNKKTLFVDESKLTVTIADEVIKKIVKDNPFHNKCTFVVEKDLAFVCFFDDFGSDFPMVVVDTPSGRTLWSIQLWGYGGDNLPFKSGQWKHDLSIVRQGDRVVVFGYGTECHLEVVQISTRKSIMRFSSNCWYWDD
jgi:hypothetical protein